MTRRALSLALLALAPALAWGLSSDRQEPAYIQADRAELNDKTGVSRYHGDVVLDQGTLHVEAETLVVHRKDGALSRIIADGEPVKFRQLPDDAEAPMHGRALHVEYDAADEVVTLEGAARLWQAKDEFTGDRIVYDTASGVVQAEGGATAEDGRVHAIIHPKEEDGEP